MSYPASQNNDPVTAYYDTTSYQTRMNMLRREMLILLLWGEQNGELNQLLFPPDQVVQVATLEEQTTSRTTCRVTPNSLTRELLRIASRIACIF